LNKLHKAKSTSYHARYCFGIAAILGTLEYVFVQQGEEIKNSGVRSFFKNLVM